MKLKVIDIDTNDIAYHETSLQIGVETVYRNSDTKKLDARYEGTAPLPMGSCFDEGNGILVPLANAGKAAGFYFGVEKSVFPEKAERLLAKCIEESTIEIVDYQGEKIVIPIGFK